MQLQNKINTYLHELGTDCKDITYIQFLQGSHVIHEQYILTLCSTLKKPILFLKRNMKHINAYQKDLLMAWQANHGIQYVLDAYSCVRYICNYMTKAQKGVSTLMAKACKEAKVGNMTPKQSVHYMADKFLNYGESPFMEAYYYILQLPVTQSSIKKEFIMTCRPDVWVFIGKDKERLQQLHPNSEDIKLSGNIDK